MITSSPPYPGSSWGTDQVKGRPNSLAHARTRELRHFYPKAQGVPLTPSPLLEEELNAPQENHVVSDISTFIPSPKPISPEAHTEADIDELLSLVPAVVPHHRSDKSNHRPRNAKPRNKRKIRGLGAMMAIGGLISVIALAVGVLWNNINTRTPQEQANLLQVFTKSDAYRVLLLPLEPTNPDQTTYQAEKVLQTWINATPEADDIMLEAAFVAGTQFPRSHEEAKRIGEVYEADMVLWGASNPTKDGKYHLRYASVRRPDQAQSFKQGLGRQATDNVYDLREGDIAGTKDDIVNLILAFGQLREEQYNAAYSTLQSIPTYHMPEMATVHHLLAKCYQGMHHLEESLRSYQAAIESAPASVNLLAHQAALLLQMENQEAALVSYNKALAINPLHLDALASRSALIEEQSTNAPKIEFRTGPVYAMDTDHPSTNQTFFAP